MDTLTAKTASRLFGLIGYPLSHSFSKKYFAEKFTKEHIHDAYYELFPIEKIDQLPDLIKNFPKLIGLNVTIPYKQTVIPFIDELHESAGAIGAVNTIKVKDNKLVGFNSDVYGFQLSLEHFLERWGKKNVNALVLGTGGAAKAVNYVLEKMKISALLVSRNPEKGDLIYEDIDEQVLKEYPLIINTTPLGMAPNIESLPNLPYHYISKENLLYDLVYNPLKTRFLLEGERLGCPTKNGIEMLHMQAERSWTFWNEH